MRKTLANLIFIVCNLTILGFSQGVDAGKSVEKPSKQKIQKPVSKPPSKPVTKPSPPPKQKVANKPKPSTNKQKTSSVTTAELQIFVQQEEVKIFVDNVEYETESGVSPFIFDGLKPGNYSIRVEKVGYQTETKNIKLTANQKASININLVVVSGFLEIRTTYPDAVIQIGNQIFNGQAKLNLPEGQYSYSVKKKGYKNAGGTVAVLRGQTNVQVVTLQAFTAEEYLLEANNYLTNGDFSNAAAAARRVLKFDKNNNEALSISAACYENLGYLSASFPYYSVLLNNGKKITLPFKFSKKSSSLEAGRILLERDKLSFWSDASPGLIFSVNSSDIQELKLENSNIQIKANISNGQKTKKETYYFDSQNFAFRASFFKLLQQIKTGISLQETGLGIVYLPVENFKLVTDEGFSFEIPENWLEFYRNSTNRGQSVGYAPKGGFERNSKQFQYSHGVFVSSVILTPPIANTPQVIANNAINLTLQNYPKSQRLTQLQEITINEKQVFMIRVKNIDNPQIQPDLVNFYVHITPNNRLLLINTVVPMTEEDDYAETMDRIIKSFFSVSRINVFQ